MPKKRSTKTIKPKVLKDFNFPAHKLTIKASTLKEAIKILNSRVKGGDN